MTILAHRGLRRSGPENSLAGLQGVAEAAAQGLDLGVEFDVRQTADGQLVLSHDEMQGPVSVPDTWLESARRILGPDALPLLADALEVIADHAPMIDMEIKTSGYTDDVLALVQHLDPSRVMLSSHVPRVVADLHSKIHPEMRLGLLVNNFWHWDSNHMLEVALCLGPTSFSSSKATPAQSS